ncbi:hypothetical protein [Siminovitchia fordii]|uniref:Uncharacterized protein n=1 Tax=Siminovitchia fordii TaxID=254759 RepID=A0ABQ4K303_9BACI|nr:hypothetical protein [Siminovitchia fordii]GIN20114.1 hypothetical protein J1TS3_12480 [Siminovitchia fordii]
MRINEKSRYAGSALPNTAGLDLQNLLDRESEEGPAQFMHESGWDNSGIQLLKRELKRG